MTLAREPEEVTTGFLDRLLAELRVACGSLLLVDQNGELVEILRRGMATTRWRGATAGAKSPAEVILASRQPFIARVDEVEPAQLLESPWMEEVRNLNLIGVLAVPLVAQDRPLGLVTAYADTARGPFEDEELELATAIGANAATALANARAWRSLEQLNRSLEEAVAERTKELQEALQHARRRSTEQLEDRNLALEAANRQLRDLERLKGDLLNRIAHELNTPVTAIQTAGRILTRYDEVPAEKAVKFVEIITQESTRLAELIASALQAAVLGVPEGRPAPTAVNLTELLKRVLAPLKGEIAQAPADRTGEGRVRPRADHRRRRPARGGAAGDRQERRRVQPRRRQPCGDGASPCAAAPTRWSRCASRTPASASPPRTCRTCARSSGRAATSSPTSRAASASGSRWRGASRRTTAARSRSPRRRARARSSRMLLPTGGRRK